jgi:hypothetical protein
MIARDSGADRNGPRRNEIWSCSLNRNAAPCDWLPPPTGATGTTDSAGQIRRPPWQSSYHDLLETIFVFTVLAILYGLAPRFYGVPALSARAAAVEALGLSVSQQVCMQEGWAVAGRFPAPAACIDTNPKAHPPGSFVTAVVAPGSAPSFQYIFGSRMPVLNRKQLAIWAAAGPGEFPATWIWRCGPADPGLGVAGLDRSTIPAALLPSACRAVVVHVPPT